MAIPPLDPYYSVILKAWIGTYFWHDALVLLLPFLPEFQPSKYSISEFVPCFLHEILDFFRLHAWIILQVCLNKNECTVALTEESFNMGLCPGIIKKLAVEGVCSWVANLCRHLIRLHEGLHCFSVTAVTSTNFFYMYGWAGSLLSLLSIYIVGNRGTIHWTAIELICANLDTVWRSVRGI